MAPRTFNLRTFFQGKSILAILISINIGVFLLVVIAGIVSALFKSNSHLLLSNLELPAELYQLIRKPWTLITYMFTHQSFFHILFNLLWLYWFGQLFVNFFGARPLGGLYFLGGLAGAFFFIAAYNLFPYFEGSLGHSYLIGASASIMAVVFAAAFYRPDFTINLFLFGSVKIIYIALLLLVINIITLPTSTPQGEIILNNAGGFFAHLGGIAMGIWFASRWKQGKDLTRGMNSLLDSIANSFKKKEKKPKSKMKVKYKRTETDMQYNARKNEEQAEIDRILDKIKRSGYDTLTDKEKNTLFGAGKK
ncbi:rhomboid family intramembrane serine protease [Bacteroidales bacterium OttesenSCG-928-J19]|nr:rhomboid family intramembrane serine protease [Bacteroidales bacterium OttesenSCG-928-J19]